MDFGLLLKATLDGLSDSLKISACSLVLLLFTVLMLYMGAKLVEAGYLNAGMFIALGLPLFVYMRVINKILDLERKVEELENQYSEENHEAEKT